MNGVLTRFNSSVVRLLANIIQQLFEPYKFQFQCGAIVRHNENL